MTNGERDKCKMARMKVNMVLVKRCLINMYYGRNDARYRMLDGCAARFRIV